MSRPSYYYSLDDRYREPSRRRPSEVIRELREEVHERRTREARELADQQFERMVEAEQDDNNEYLERLGVTEEPSLAETTNGDMHVDTGTGEFTLGAIPDPHITQTGNEMVANRMNINHLTVGEIHSVEIDRLQERVRRLEDMVDRLGNLLQTQHQVNRDFLEEIEDIRTTTGEVTMQSDEMERLIRELTRT